MWNNGMLKYRNPGAMVEKTTELSKIPSTPFEYDRYAVKKGEGGIENMISLCLLNNK